jgi:DUF4097 and DUF4098 domain-containing protein YvlB
MERIKTRLIIAVSSKLAAAEESNAKTDLIEELSENLYQRYLEMVQAGTPEDEAYQKALDDLGDVDELLAYLGSLGPSGELPRQDSGRLDDFLQGAEDIVRETITQTKGAVDQAKVIVRDVGKKLKEKYPDFRGSVESVFGGDEDHPGGEPVSDRTIPSQDLSGLDIKLHNGDVTLRLSDESDCPVLLEADTEKLEVERAKDGTLTIRQRSTASSSFFLSRGLGSTDVELWLPRRAWDTVLVSTANGDVEIDPGLTAKRLSVKTANGDLQLGDAALEELQFKTASGDLDCAGGAITSLQAETMSGDISVKGEFDTVRACSVSGDMVVMGKARSVRCSSASGDMTVATETAPELAELSAKSGDCRLLLPEGEDFVLQFSTVSGKIESEFPLTGPVGAKTGEAVHQSGGQRRYHLTTVSGDIRLEKL